MSDFERKRTPMTRREFLAWTSLLGVAGNAAAPNIASGQDGGAVEGPSSSQQITLTVNGVARSLTVDPRVTLLDAVRDHLGLTGTKKGCDQGTCGACTVLVNGRRIVSCLTLAVMHTRDRITTIEGLGSPEKLHPLQAAFIKRDGFQCGYCTPGQIMSAAGMLSEGHALDAQTIREQMSGNLCRCGCYPHIVEAVLDAAQHS